MNNHYLENKDWSPTWHQGSENDTETKRMPKNYVMERGTEPS